MASVRSKNTRPELLLRRALHARGLRYRLHMADLPGRPDIVFTKQKLAVFVDGDFWHGSGWQERGFESFEEQFTHHANPDKWIAKITRNMARDAEVNQALRERGWRVLRILESELKADPNSVADRVAAAVRASPTQA